MSRIMADKFTKTSGIKCHSELLLKLYEAINRGRAYDLMYYDVLCELGTCAVESATIVERSIRERFASHHTKHGGFYKFCNKETY
ncbi:hypothetical protein [Heliothis virescens ascovirus 3j]|uniref:Uncharacterized protein n=1 Tax=Heliothis virescens ascovirus 3j TaxID=1561067 RepID=A0A2Z5UZV2_9VIRU|nr:hypothetical protein [Heliothis virescens ascovirus 3j]